MDFERKEMVQAELRDMEKRSRKMNELASKSMDRRNEWIRHTLDVIEKDINRGGRQEIEEAQQIANGKSSTIFVFLEFLYQNIGF